MPLDNEQPSKSTLDPIQGVSPLIQAVAIALQLALDWTSSRVLWEKEAQLSDLIEWTTSIMAALKTVEEKYEPVIRMTVERAQELEWFLRNEREKVAQRDQAI